MIQNGGPTYGTKVFEFRVDDSRSDFVVTNSFVAFVLEIFTIELFCIDVNFDYKRVNLFICVADMLRLFSIRILKIRNDINRLLSNLLRV